MIKLEHSQRTQRTFKFYYSKNKSHVQKLVAQINLFKQLRQPVQKYRHRAVFCLSFVSDILRTHAQDILSPICVVCPPTTVGTSPNICDPQYQAPTYHTEPQATISSPDIQYQPPTHKGAIPVTPRRNFQTVKFYTLRPFQGLKINRNLFDRSNALKSTKLFFENETVSHKILKLQKEQFWSWISTVALREHMHVINLRSRLINLRSRLTFLRQ